MPSTQNTSSAKGRADSKGLPSPSQLRGSEGGHTAGQLAKRERQLKGVAQPQPTVGQNNGKGVHGG